MRTPGLSGGVLASYLGRQRWYAGSLEPDPAGVTVVEAEEMLAVGDGRLHWAVVESEGARYQVLLAERPAVPNPAVVDGRGDALAGIVGESVFYDGTVDAGLMLAWYRQVIGDEMTRVRAVGAEQSNTSLIFDDRVIVKVYRRLLVGTNPDIEVTSGLSAAGFAHVAAPVGRWTRRGVDLAFAQQYLAGGSEGWALAVTSLQDFYQAGLGGVDSPGEAGGDFASEARRLGQMTAGMHLALASVFGTDPSGVAASWPQLIADIVGRLDLLVGDPNVGLGTRTAAAVAERLRLVRHHGPALRVHGDYHLGQVMRTDAGWYVLDFEGEPARPLDERIRRSSAAKDVAGMLRSFDYAARFARRQSDGDPSRDDERGERWEARNAGAFLDGYSMTGGVDALLAPAGDDRDTVTAAFELDKALYELAYEEAYRPSWADIPAGAVRRAVASLLGGSPPGPPWSP